MYNSEVWRLLFHFKERTRQKNCMAGVVELHHGGQDSYVLMESYVEFVYNKLAYWKKVETGEPLVEWNEDITSLRKALDASFGMACPRVMQQFCRPQSATNANIAFHQLRML